MTTGREWQAQVGRTWADNYALTDRSFAGLTKRLLERIEEGAGRSILDIGCGAGELALLVAQMRPDAQLIGLDLSSDLIDAARARAGGQFANLEFELGDAAIWRKPGFTPDLVISRHGVMFFEDPPGAFAAIRQGTQTGARLLFSCFRSPADNPWASGISRLLGIQPGSDPRAPGPFAFSDEGYVRSILEAAGWNEVAFEAADFPYVAGIGVDPVEDALRFFRRIGPAAPVLRSLEGEAREAAEARIRDWLGQHRTGDRVVLAGAAWIVSASNG